MNKQLTSALNSFQVTMENAIHSGISSKEDLSNSPLYDDVWIASYKLAKEIVSLRYDASKDTCFINAWDQDDLISEFTMHLVDKYVTQVDAVIRCQSSASGKIRKHNYNAYNTVILTNIIQDINDNNQIKGFSNTSPLKKNHYNFLSLSATISGDKDGSTLGDILPSLRYSPETNVLLRDTIVELLSIKKERESNLLSHHYEALKFLVNKKYLGQAWCYIEDTLKKNKKKCYLDKIIAVFNKVGENTPELQLAANKAFVTAYNKDLKRFVSYVCSNDLDCKDVDFIFLHSATDISDFGRNFKVSADKFYKLKYINKKELEQANLLPFTDDLLYEKARRAIAM